MLDESLSIFLKRIVALCGVALVLYAIFLARTPLTWVGVAAFLAVAINPMVRQVQRYMPRKNLGLAALVVLAIFCIVSVGLAWVLFAPLVNQTTQLIASLPELAAQANQLLAHTPFADAFKTASDQLATAAAQIGLGILSVVNSVIGAVVAFVTVIALMFFMILEGPTIKQTALRLIPHKLRNDSKELGGKVYLIINGYVVGNFLLSMMYGLASGLLLWLLGNPYFLVLGLIAALLDLIPLLGSTLAAVLIGLVCLVSGQAGAAAIFALFTIVYVQLENAVLNPMVYSKKVDISPLTVLIAVLVGAAIAGVLGTLLAIPVVAALKETGKLYLKHQADNHI